MGHPACGNQEHSQGFGYILLLSSPFILASSPTYTFGDSRLIHTPTQLEMSNRRTGDSSGRLTKSSAYPFRLMAFVSEVLKRANTNRQKKKRIIDSDDDDDEPKPERSPQVLKNAKMPRYENYREVLSDSSTGKLVHAFACQTCLDEHLCQILRATASSTLIVSFSFAMQLRPRMTLSSLDFKEGLHGSKSPTKGSFVRKYRQCYPGKFCLTSILLAFPSP